MKVINLWASPSSGKSTTSLGLVYMMKLAGYSVEYVDEYAKQLVWERRHPDDFKNQINIANHQHNKLHDLSKHNVDYVVCDSPLLMTLLYMPENYFKAFPDLIFEMNDQYENVHILLERNFPYVQEGRLQNEMESAKIHENIKDFLFEYEINHLHLESNKKTAKKIFKKLKKDKLVFD